MKKVKTAAALLCSACLVLSGTAVPTMADSVKVVTLGADLTQDQKNTMMKYFNVDSNQVQILTITNQDERDHLSAYVPLERNQNSKLCICKADSVRRYQSKNSQP